MLRAATEVSLRGILFFDIKKSQGLACDFFKNQCWANPYDVAMMLYACFHNFVYITPF